MFAPKRSVTLQQQYWKRLRNPKGFGPCCAGDFVKHDVMQNYIGELTWVDAYLQRPAWDHRLAGYSIRIESHWSLRSHV